MDHFTDATHKEPTHMCSQWQMRVCSSFRWHITMKLLFFFFFFACNQINFSWDLLLKTLRTENHQSTRFWGLFCFNISSIFGKRDSLTFCTNWSIQSQRMPLAQANSIYPDGVCRVKGACLTTGNNSAHLAPTEHWTRNTGIKHSMCINDIQGTALPYLRLPVWNRALQMSVDTHPFQFLICFGFLFFYSLYKDCTRLETILAQISQILQPGADRKILATMDQNLETKLEKKSKRYDRKFCRAQATERQYLTADRLIWLAKPDIFCMDKPFFGSELTSADETCLWLNSPRMSKVPTVSWQGYILGHAWQ